MVDIWKKLIQLPRSCLLCGGACEASGAASCCDACYAELPWNDHACGRCGIPLTMDARVCGRCLKTPPPFDAALCVFHYQFPVNRLLVKLKFHAKLGYARELGMLLAAQVERRHAEWGSRLPEAIVPVPLHPGRLKSRGFNQAAEIARVVGARLDLPVLTDLCERRLDTAAQSALAADARRRNVRGAFAVRRPLPVRRLAIVDDVVTTGATVGEVARALLAAGAEKVLVWSPARA